MPDLVKRLTAALADRYGFDRELGRGEMATVYLASVVRQGENVQTRRPGRSCLRPIYASLDPTREEVAGHAGEFPDRTRPGLLVILAP